MTFGIIGALPEEIAPVLAHYKDYETLEFGGNTFYKIKAGNKTAMLACSRIGKVHAALTASTMILHFGCEKSYLMELRAQSIQVIKLEICFLQVNCVSTMWI